MEELINRAIADIKVDLQKTERDGTFFFPYTKGKVSGKYEFENDMILVSLQCETKQRIFYTVSFRYRKMMRKYLIDRRMTGKVCGVKP